MIAKRRRGSNVGGLLRYLFGRGRANEHTDPHLVAAWDEEWLPGGAFAELPRARLARALDAHRLAHEIPAGEHVYHVVISLPEGDGRPGGAIWREVVADGIAWMGLSQCRWVAVHHGTGTGGNDHVHLVLVDVEPGGHRPRLYRDFNRWRDWCNAVEARMGWTPTAPARAGRPGASWAEVERDRRSGQRPGSGRTALQRAVHAAAVAAGGEREFFEQLAARRVAVRLRTDAAGRVRGYAVARTTKGRPSGPWISGSRLRRDLSLPRLRARWSTDSPSRAGDAGLEVLLRGCEPELATWLHRHPGPDPAGWCAAASAVADLTITVAGWQPALHPAARALAAAAQPARRTRRLGGPVLPLVRMATRALAAGVRPGPVLLATAVVTIAALTILLAAAVGEYRTHAAARRHLRHAHQITTEVAGQLASAPAPSGTTARQRAAGQAAAALAPPPRTGQPTTSSGHPARRRAVPPPAAQRRSGRQR